MSPMNPKLLRPRLTGDPDALRYIAAVQAADGQTLEPAVAKAISDFVVGCKLDGIWTALKASCILAGARTLSGALTPLVGSSPTNNNFVSGDYDRKTGLVGNGSTKYINTNRNNNVEPQNSQHAAVYVSTAHTTSAGGATNGFSHYLGAGGDVTGSLSIGRFSNNSTSVFVRSRSSAAASLINSATATGFVGKNRSASTGVVFRHSGITTAEQSLASETPANVNIGVFVSIRSAGPDSVTYSNGRLAFYSVGESLTLATLDTRVTNLINAIAAAIP